MSCPDSRPVLRGEQAGEKVIGVKLEPIAKLHFLVFIYLIAFIRFDMRAKKKPLSEQWLLTNKKKGLSFHEFVDAFLPPNA